MLHLGVLGEPLELRVIIEMVLQGSLAPPGDDQDVVGARGHRLLHDVLDDRAVDDRGASPSVGFSSRAGTGCRDRPLGSRPSFPPPGGTTGGPTCVFCDGSPYPERDHPQTRPLGHSRGDRPPQVDQQRRAHDLGPSRAPTEVSGQSAWRTATSAPRSVRGTEAENVTRPGDEAARRLHSRSNLDSAAGSWNRMRAPAVSSRSAIGNARDSRTSSVPALKARPSIATVFPRRVPAATRTSSKAWVVWSTLIASAVSADRIGIPSSSPR